MIQVKSQEFEALYYVQRSHEYVWVDYIFQLMLRYALELFS